MVTLSNYQLTRDIINLEPLDVKHVVITRQTWERIRPVIKYYQKYGLWYDIASYGDKLYFRCKVNDITQSFIESLL